MAKWAIVLKVLYQIYNLHKILRIMGCLKYQDEALKQFLEHGVLDYERKWIWGN